jgi:hypothetical protein
MGAPSSAATVGTSRRARLARSRIAHHGRRKDREVAEGAPLRPQQLDPPGVDPDVALVE